MRCPYCKSELSTNINICANCGQVIETHKTNLTDEFWEKENNDRVKENKRSQEIELSEKNRLKKQKAQKLITILGALAVVAILCVVIISVFVTANQKHNNPSTATNQDNNYSSASEQQTSNEFEMSSEDKQMQSLEIPAPKDNTITVDGIFVGQTQTIAEESVISYNGSLYSDDDYDVYSYTAPRDGRYAFGISNISANDNVRLMIFDSLRNLKLDSWSGYGYVDLTCGETYEIQVRQDNGYPEYILNIYVQKQTVDLSNTTTVYDQVAFEDQNNIYTFTAPISGRYHFELSEYRNGVDFRMMMWDSLDNNIMDSWSGSATVDLNAGETYNFQIKQDQNIGSYKLSIGFQKETVDLTGVTTAYDSIEYTDQKNVYSFTAPISGRYHFELSEYKNGVDFRMMMWDSLDNNIMDSWSGSATVDLNAGETYNFQIRQDKGYYSYKLKIGYQKDTVDISEYDIILDSITFENQKNTYTFTPKTTAKYVFSLANTDSSSSFRMMAWDNYENNVMDTYSETGSVVLEKGITYTIQVHQDESFDSYKLQIEKQY